MTRHTDAAAGLIVDAMQEVIASAVLRNELIARRFGMNVVDLQALNVLARADDPLTASELAARTGLPTSTVTRVVDRLEKAGLAHRRADDADRRRIRIVADLANFFHAGDPYERVRMQLDDINLAFTHEELLAVARYLQAVATAIPATDALIEGDASR